MSSNHDHNDHHSNEPKSVSFRTPLILGLVTVLLILLLVNTCDKKHDCCENGEKCDSKTETTHGGHDEHNATATEYSNVEGHEHDVVTEETAAIADSIMKVDTTMVKEEHAHH